MRTTKCTDEIRDSMVLSFSKGLPISTVCGLHGIHRATYYDWVKRAERYISSKDSDPNDSIYYHWYILINKARQEFVSQMLEKVRSIGFGQDETTIHESYNVKDGEKVGESLIRKVTRRRPNFHAIAFILQSLHPGSFGSKLRLDRDLIDEYILRELDRVTGRHEGRAPEKSTNDAFEEASDFMAEDSSAQESEDWANL